LIRQPTSSGPPSGRQQALMVAAELTEVETYSSDTARQLRGD
jgi:hypothetical protein